MRTYNVRILANNEAGTWASWDEKIKETAAFYSPACILNITVTPTKLTPQFAPYAPISGSADTYVVDQAWYDANVVPLAEGADIVMFVVPPSDHPNIVTYMGLDVFQQRTIGKTTVFADETSHTYVNGVDQGETAALLAKHELSHQFYAMLAKTDNTHLYFYAGSPEKVLADFDFDTVAAGWLSQVLALLEQEIPLIKAGQPSVITDAVAQAANIAKPSQSQDLPPESVAAPEATQTTSSGPSVADLFNFIRGYEGWAAPGETLNGTEYPNGSISYQCNNPMNAKWASQEYATPRTFEIAGRQEIFAAFDTLEHGNAYGTTCLTEVINGTDAVYNVAAHNLSLANSGDLSLNQFFAIRDAASDGNNPDQYAAAAGKQFGVNPATFLMKQFAV